MNIVSLPFILLCLLAKLSKVQSGILPPGTHFTPNQVFTNAESASRTARLAALLIEEDILKRKKRFGIVGDLLDLWDLGGAVHKLIRGAGR